MTNDAYCADNGAILNAYPDSMGGTLGQIVAILRRPAFQRAFCGFYILPSLFHSDLDRGFSVIDYGLNESLASREDLDALQELGIDLKLDFILNHMSVQSPQFQDLLQKGKNSIYSDFFIDWNQFWAGHGTMMPEGFIQPFPELLSQSFFRKPGLPFLMVRMPDGEEIPYWNTFYQEVCYPELEAQELMQKLGLPYPSAASLCRIVNDALRGKTSPGEIPFGEFEPYRPLITEYLESKRRYLGQMDLNVQSPRVWEFYEKTLHTLAGYGAKIVRLDAFAYASKAPGRRNFLNEPETWEILDRLRVIADHEHIKLLPEIHASYAEGVYQKISEKGYLVYDFFLPGLILDAFEEKSCAALCHWAQELVDKEIHTVNMLGCHDGIPLLDLQGLIAESQIQRLIDIVVSRGGYVKNLYGKKMYYQVNATYFSALGEDENRLLLARAVQLFMPGIPQIWYLDLFAGKNDMEAVRRAGSGGHKEINRTNLTIGQVEAGMDKSVVRRQLELLRWRNTFPAFGSDAQIQVTRISDSQMKITWTRGGYLATLDADFAACKFAVGMQSPDCCFRYLFS